MAAEEDFVLSFTGEETDNLLKHTESMKNQTTEEDGETVQVYDTNGVPHKVSKTELLKKSTLALPALEDISSFVAINAAGNAVGLMTKEQVASVRLELVGVATPKKSGLHPAAKFSQSDNSGVASIDDITVLSTDIYNGKILERSSTFIIKTYPASPSYMYQEAMCMYPYERYWRAKVDGSWREWNKI